MRTFVGLFVPIGALLIVAACQSSKPIAPPGPPLRTSVAINEIMASMVEPSADALWNAVATNVTGAGADEKAPKSDKDWAELRGKALMLVEAMNLIVVDGRKVAPAGTKSANPGAELEPAQIEALLAQDRHAFVDLAHNLQDTGLSALKAIEARDPEKLSDAGGDIDAACEKCHLEYWYPNKKA